MYILTSKGVLASMVDGLTIARAIRWNVKTDAKRSNHGCG